MSSNASLLHAAALVAPPGVEVELFEGIGDLPHFNPDQAEEEPGPALAKWRAALESAEAVLICSPEYAHGVPGSLKNALDWVVASGEFSQKPVGILNASLQSFHAHNSLMEIVQTMDARVVVDASPRIPVTQKGQSPEQLAQNPAIAEPLQAAIAALVAAAQTA